MVILLRIFTNISAEISIERSKLKAVNNRVTFYQVASKSMENSIYTCLDLLKLNISHFAMLLGDLWKFLYTCLDQL